MPIMWSGSLHILEKLAVLIFISELFAPDEICSCGTTKLRITERQGYLRKRQFAITIG